MTERIREKQAPDPANLLYEALDANELDDARELIARLHSFEIADLLESLPGALRTVAWSLMDSEIQGEVLSHMQDAVRAEFLEHMRLDEVVQVASALDTDDAADILQDLSDDVLATVLSALDEQNRRRLSSVLSYPEDTAGGLMNIDVILIRADVTLEVVARYLRRLSEIPEKTDNLIVVDRDNHYLGVLLLSEILIRDPDITVGETMIERVSIEADVPEREVSRLFEQRDLVSAAVVDKQNHLLGRITVDDVLGVMQKNEEQLARNMAGLGKDDMFSPIIATARRRALWLGINLATAFFASWVIGRFEDTIQQLVALAVLMPIVAGMGGIAGSQTLTIAVRGIALGQITRINIRALMLKEIAVGLLNGMIWSIVVAVIVIFWFSNIPLGVIIAVAMIINLFAAALTGAAIPLILKYYGIDPAIAGGVILTTVTDAVGFVTFLGLASIFLLS